MGTNFGPRNARLESTPKPPAHGSGRAVPDVAQAGTLTAASSRLVVARAFTTALPFARMRHVSFERVLLEELPWSDDLLQRIDNGTLDLAVYNHLRGIALADQYPNVHLLGPIGYSMGGRNFCMLTNQRGKWAESSLTDLRQHLRDAVLVVGRNTDRFHNLLDILDLNARELSDRGITILDIADAPCSMLDSMPDALVVCGQNRRFEARLHHDLLEVSGFRDLPQDAKAAIRRRSANSLLVSTRIMESVSVSASELVLDIVGGVAEVWNSSYDSLLDIVARESEFDSLDPDQRRDAAKQIIFDTYRFGSPE